MSRRKGTEWEKLASRLWKEHARAEFPARLRGEEVAGVDLVMLDADIAGCVVTWQGNHGFLDEGQRQLLARLLRDVDQVVPLLEDDGERAYYERLGHLGRLVYDSAPRGARTYYPNARSCRIEGGYVRAAPPPPPRSSMQAVVSVRDRFVQLLTPSTAAGCGAGRGLRNDRLERPKHP